MSEKKSCSGDSGKANKIAQYGGRAEGGDDAWNDDVDTDNKDVESAINHLRDLRAQECKTPFQDVCRRELLMTSFLYCPI